VGRDSVVGIATRYGLDGPRIEHLRSRHRTRSLHCDEKVKIRK